MTDWRLVLVRTLLFLYGLMGSNRLLEQLFFVVAAGFVPSVLCSAKHVFKCLRGVLLFVCLFIYFIYLFHDCCFSRRLFLFFATAYDTLRGSARLDATPYALRLQNIYTFNATQCRVRDGGARGIHNRHVKPWGTRPTSAPTRRAPSRRTA